MLRRGRTALVLGLAAAGVAAHAQEFPRVEGRLGAVSGRDYTLMADLGADLQFDRRWGATPFFSVASRTAIDRTTGDLSFNVKELDYRGEAGVRLAATAETTLALFAGQLGKEFVDADGSRAAAYVGAGLATRGWRGPGRPRVVEAELALGLTVRRRGLDARGYARGGVRFRSSGRRWGASVRAEALFGGADHGVTFAAGPFLDLGWARSREAALFVEYEHSRMPALPAWDGWIAGLRLSGDSRPPDATGLSVYSRPHEERLNDPGVGGQVEAGAGGGRHAARLKTFFSSPSLGNGFRLTMDVDANVVTGVDTSELYYLLEGGVRRPASGVVWSLDAFHRSNHRLATPGSTVTSDNALLLGVETPGWDRRAIPGSPPLSFRLRLGRVVQSSFDGSRWQARVGLRWEPFRWSTLQPFLLADVQAGDVGRTAFAAGLSTGRSYEVRVERRSDRQFYGRDKALWMLVAARRL